MIFKPYYKIGSPGFSGKNIWFKRFWFISISKGEPQIVPFEPKNPRKIQAGGLSFGFRGYNYWISI